MNNDILWKIATKCDTQTLCSMNIASKAVNEMTREETEYHKYRKELKSVLTEYKDTKKKANRKKKKYYSIIDCLVKYSTCWMNPILKESHDAKNAKKAIYMMCCLPWISWRKKRIYLERLHKKHPNEAYNLITKRELR